MLVLIVIELKWRELHYWAGVGGTGEVQKKYSRKENLNEKKFVHAN